MIVAKVDDTIFLHMQQDDIFILCLTSISYKFFIVSFFLFHRMSSGLSAVYFYFAQIISLMRTILHCTEIIVKCGYVYSEAASTTVLPTH